MQDPTPSEVLQFVRDHSKPFVTSEDVDDHFDEVTDRTLRDRLNMLVKENELEVRTVGANSKVWYCPSYSSKYGPADASRRFPSSDSQ